MNMGTGNCSGSSASCGTYQQHCDIYTACGAGGCSSSYRCSSSDYCHSSEDAYWNNFVCGPNTGSCNYVTDKVDCPACQYCPGGTYGSCRAYTNNTQDTTTPNYCNGVCQACQGGYCSYALSGTDPNDRCITDYGRSCASGCQRVVDTGLCGLYGVCATTTKYCDYGTSCYSNSGVCYSWYYCNYTDVCWLDTYYNYRTCNSSGTCNIVVGDIGCCQGSKCSSGQYCEQSTHQCTALPDCATRNESGFGYTSACSASYCYRDIDGDGWPAASGTKTCQSSPILYKTDCCDTDAGVHPGIPDPPYRSTPSACGGWDLNCDGSVTTSGYDCAKCSSCYVSGSTCSILCSNPRPTHNATCSQAACGETFSATRCAATLYSAGCGTFNIYYYKTGTDNVTCSDWQGGGLKSTTLQGYGTQTCKCK